MPKSRTLLQLLATIYQDTHIFEASVSSVSQETHRQAEPSHKPQGSTTNNLPSDAKCSTTAEVNTYCSMKGKSRNHILLAIGIVEFKIKSGQYVPCRAFLDSASQSHFITERCVQHLRLSRTQTHASIQGISNINTATNHIVSIHLRSRHTDWHTTLDCAILSNITGI
jgi:hypothetical protein